MALSFVAYQTYHNCPPFHVVCTILTVTVMDARNMEYIPEQCFDLIIDKGELYGPSLESAVHSSCDTCLSFALCFHPLFFGSLLPTHFLGLVTNFDIAGLFDALLCSENNLKDIEALMHEMYRVLKTGGSYVIISHGYPDNRTSHIRRYLDVEVEVIPIRKLLRVEK